MLLLSIEARAQNPVLEDTGRGTKKIGSKLGLNTNGVTIGNYLQFTTTGIFWNASSGGAGSAAAAVTNGFNWYLTSSTNVFNGITTFNSNTFVYGAITINTNATPQLGNTVFYAQGSTDTVAHLKSPQMILTDHGLAGGSTVFYLGDPLGDGNSHYMDIQYDHDGNMATLESRTGGSSLRLRADGTLYQNIAGTDKLTLTSSTFTIGSASSDTVVINGATASFANNLMWGSGALYWPSSTAATSTNGWTTNYFGGDVNVLKNFAASNITARTTDGTATISSGTNLTMVILSASNLATKAYMASRTNTLTAALPVINTIYTNNDTRLYLNIMVKIPATLTASSSCALWTASGTMTNYQGLVSSSGGLADTITNNVTGMVDPLALYMITNTDVNGGTPALIPGLWNEKRL